MASDRGKKIDTWEFSINHVAVKVSVKLRTTRNGVEFFVKDESYSLSESDSDINALKKKVAAHLQGFLRVEWRRYFLVKLTADVKKAEPEEDIEFDEDSYQRAFEVNVYSKLKVEEIEIGEKPDGSKCWRDWSPHNNHRSENGLPETGVEEERWDDSRTVTSIVPATTENREALLNMQAALQAINAKLLDFLLPDKVESNLADSATFLKLDFAAK